MVRYALVAMFACLATPAVAADPACNGRTDILSLTRCLAGSLGILTYPDAPGGDMCRRREVPAGELLEPVPMA